MKFRLRIPEPIKRAGVKIGMRLKKASPEICFVVGLGLGIYALVETGKQTYKNHKTLAENAKRIDAAKNSELPKKEHRAAVAAAIINSGKDGAKIYLKPAVAYGASAALIWCGRTILRKDLAKYIALSGMWKQAYEQYRDQQLIGGPVTENQALESGEAEKSNLPINKNDIIDPLTFVFNDGEWDDSYCKYNWKNRYWSPSKIYNIMKARNAQIAINSKLKTGGYITALDVLQEFDIKPVVNGKLVPLEKLVYVYGGAHGERNPEYDEIDLGIFPNEQHPEWQNPLNKRFLDENDGLNYCLITLRGFEDISTVLEDVDEYDARSNRFFDKRRRGIK